MSVNLLKIRAATLNLRSLTVVQKCSCTSKVQKIVGGIEVEEVPVYDAEPKYDELDLDRIRDKSRLNPQHRNMLYEEAPYAESHAGFHDTVGYRRKLLGRYGLNAPNVNPKWCWPTKEEIEDIKEYESLLYPYTIQEEWKRIEEKNKEAALKIKQREEDIDKVVANFDKWKAALNAKIAKKEAELLAAKQRKEALLEEIREQFGFQIDPKDERYQEALALKEKEDKKKKKEAKKKMRQEKMLAHLAKQEEESRNKTEQKAKEKDGSKVEEKSSELKTEEKINETDNKKTE